jgi:hypothetical protein
MALMERRRLQVPMDEILDAMSSGGDEYVFFFLDLQTGRVESSLNPDFYGELDENETDFDRLYEEEPERFEEIPKYESREDSPIPSTRRTSASGSMWRCKARGRSVAFATWSSRIPT